MRQAKKLNKLSILSQISLKLIIGLFIASSLVTVFALRHNNQTMSNLRDDLYATDKSGKDVNEALDNLRLYVYGHMNTNLSSGNNTIKPPIQLKYTYDRLQAAEQKRVDDVNSNVYTQAQNYCQRRDATSFYGYYRVPCVKAYIKAHGLSASSIPVELYQFDFVSPTWSWDFAGWSLLITTVLLIILLLKVFFGRTKQD